MAVKPKPIVIQAEIIDAAKKGDQFAISEIYERCYNTVYYVVKCIIVDEDTTNDIVQDSFMKAFANIGKLSNTASFVPWLKRVATNTAKDWLKKKKPILFSNLYPDNEENDDEPEFEDITLTEQPEEALDAKVKKQLLMDIVNSLSEEQRIVVSMFYFQELPVSTIADDLGVSQNTVKSRLNYARKKIQAKVLDLEKHGTKLYGLAPVPFFIWLFLQNQKYNPAVIPAMSSASFIGAATGTAKAKTGMAATTKAASAAGKGIAVKVGAGIAGLAIAGGIAYGVVQANTPKAYSWYMEPSISATDINILVQEVPDATNDSSSSLKNWQKPYSGDACYIITDTGVGLVDYEGNTIVAPTYSKVALEENETIVLTNDTGAYTLSDENQLVPYVKPDIQSKFEARAANAYVPERDDMPVGLYLYDPKVSEENKVLYYDAGAKCDGLFAVEDDNGLWGYVDADSKKEVLPVSFAPAWNIDTEHVDIDFINKFRLNRNPVFDINMEDSQNGSGKGSFQTSRAYDATEGYIVVNIPDEGYSLITTSGDTVIPAGKFYQLRPVHDGKLWVQEKEGGQWGVLQLANTSSGKISQGVYK